MEDSKYPIVDRSEFKPNFVLRDRDDQIDISFADGIFSDGRPFRVEFWAANQVSYLTYYFSSADISNFTASDLKQYLTSEHVIAFDDEKFHACGFTGINVDAWKTVDSSGNELWAATVIVGDEDGTYIHDSVRTKRYRNEVS
jgi:hypothetical protein